ncbi:NDP-hexose 2,3-dehydratase family protein [Micromonospora sp. PLK6-60]|uniref:NDP-hexose 2,3-dehydratase family protein n=1 Tax=Micromonospora sp. PLK6-60 TaxID=2873383 RepID=UPI001CA63519|nr:NDP-hexose 2,3-dehydratase family protein [Micromonospora sp. PLK6-60]MBY8870767.1 NDP-hexose 2,3-dehydratase family protein [Micromonospora sp. PLK6-60]
MSHSTALRERAGAGRIFTESATAAEDRSVGRFGPWWSDRTRSNRFHVTPICFADLEHWGFDPETGNLGHRSGKFFTIEGLAVRSDYGPVPRWSQPIINQPEIGLCGILVKYFDGVPYCLMQAKMEPGNVNTLQLSPTVQATRSNSSRVHRGGGIRYLEHFVGADRGRVLVDVLQSEQGSWFYRKQNRNMVVEVTGEVAPHDDFCWLSLRQVLDLLHVDNLVNMDARTVLSCMPFAPPQRDSGSRHAPQGFRQALARSLDRGAAARHDLGEILSWLTEEKTRREVNTRLIPAREVTGWRRSDREIAHEAGRHFRVIAVHVEASNREVPSWRQPLLVPSARGVIAFLTKRIEGVLHVLVHARVEPGFIDKVELGPTVQCTPENHTDLPADRQPRYLDYVLAADPARIRFDALLSEEGGRFLDAQNRYLVIEVEEDFPLRAPDGYRWLTIGQLGELLRHGHYVNVQARSLVACLHSLW